MDSTAAQNANVTQHIPLVKHKTLIKVPSEQPGQATSKSHRDLEAQGSHESLNGRDQTDENNHNSPVAPPPLIKDFEKELKKRLKHNVSRKIERDKSNQNDWERWARVTFEHLQEKYTKQRHRELKSPRKLPVFEGSITYLPCVSANMSDDEDLPHYYSQKIALEDPTEIRESLDRAQAQWKLMNQSRTNDPSQLSAVRWIHLPANNEHWVKSVMPSLIATCHNARNEPLPRHADWNSMANSVFKDEFWRNQRRVRQDNPVFSRTMEPFAAYIDGRSKGRNAHSLGARVNVLVAFMPYLHWESSIAATYMKHVVNDIQRSEKIGIPSTNRFACQDELLLRTYLNGDKYDIHPRRTLDQFYYPTMEDTSERDEDQVVERYAIDSHVDMHPDFNSEPPILMVDQCWVWAIGSDTVLTAFPKTWDCYNGMGDPIDLHTTILKNIREERRHFRYLRSSCHFARFVIRLSSTNLLQPIKQVREHHKFLLYFGHAIGILRESKISNLKQLLQSLQEPDDRVKSDKVFEVRAEYRFLEEAQDITEELEMIQELLHLQHQTMRQFEQAQLKFLEESDDPLYRNFQRRRRRAMFDRPTTKARIENVGRLYMKAENLNADIHQLLRLKQQQASMIEAHYTRVLSEQGSKQSKSVMLFTVVTIIFLPLSTTAAFFGINSENLGSGSLNLGTVFAYIIPISALCVFLSLSIGLSQTVRSFLLKLVHPLSKHVLRRSATGNDPPFVTSERSITRASTQVVMNSSDIWALTNSDDEWSSGLHRNQKKGSTVPMRKLAALGTYPEQAISALHKDGDSHESHHRPESSMRRQGSCEAEMTGEPHHGDDVAMYSLSSEGDPLNIGSDFTGDEQGDSDMSLQSTRAFRRRAMKRGKLPL